MSLDKETFIDERLAREIPLPQLLAHNRVHLWQRAHNKFADEVLVSSRNASGRVGAEHNEQAASACLGHNVDADGCEHEVLREMVHEAEEQQVEAGERPLGRVEEHVAKHVAVGVRVEDAHLRRERVHLDVEQVLEQVALLHLVVGVEQPLRDTMQQRYTHVHALNGCL